MAWARKTLLLSDLFTNNTSVNLSSFFLIYEGPRSRRYGRTAALRLIVQPCDEDEDDDYYSLSFS
jgi:hypothetical protein